MKISIKESWNKISKVYQKEFKLDELKNDVHYGLATFSDTEKRHKLLGNIKGKRILDLGCGGGQNSAVLATKGATVTAVDFSESQLEHAKLLAKKHGMKIDFIRSDIRNLRQFKENHFDIVFSIYTLQYIKDLKSLFRNVNRVLKPNGVFIFSQEHPVYSSIVWNKSKKKGFFINNYFKIRRLNWMWQFKTSKIKLKFYTFHRTIEYFFESLVSNGFVVEKLLELKPDKNEKVVEPYRRANLIRIPYTILFKARKVIKK